MKSWTAGCCAAAAVAAGAYCLMLWEQGNLFDKYVSNAPEYFKDSAYSFHVRIDKSSLTGRDVTVEQSLEGKTILTYKGNVAFGWSPTAKLELTEAHIQEKLNEAILKAKPVANANFNVRFLPETVDFGFGRIELSENGQSLYFGESKLNGVVQYTGGLFAKNPEIKQADLKFAISGCDLAELKSGPVDGTLVLAPESKDLVAVTLKAKDVSQDQLNLSSVESKTGITLENKEVTQATSIQAQGFYRQKKKDLKFTVDTDAALSWPEELDLYGYMVQKGNGEADKALEEEVIKAANEGKIYLNVSKFVFDSSSLAFDLNGRLGKEAAGDKIMTADFGLDIKKSKEVLLLIPLIMPKNSYKIVDGKFTTQITAELKGDNVEVYANGKRLDAGRILD